MQRLFSTFPGRGAGLALMILRLAVAATLLSPLVTGVRLCPGSAVEVLLTLSGIAAALLAVGWWTPVAAAAAILFTVSTVWFCRATTVNALQIAILVSIGLLGAGAYSVDAHLYGRRRLVVGRPSTERE
jgi:hypothetical protein